ncbi:hypothetical protein EDE15_3238 [Edaphobacter aggregans]|uniref:Uncharacterized protein n=1 Tax=Edaphobacter aggregans TaxID=570835 RepID=A0A3R9QBE0_9BACT|nr:hypothetical protein EDE15_3238 [Edaphobacter aggregans]
MDFHCGQDISSISLAIYVYNLGNARTAGIQL